MTNKQPQRPKDKKSLPTTVISKRFENGHMLETLYSPNMGKTVLAYWNGTKVSVSAKHNIFNLTYVPINGNNNLIRHGVIHFPSYFEEFKNTEALLSDIQTFIHQYVDLEPDFEIVVAHYVLLTWVYDRFRELPYLRLTGDYGTGKTRFLQIVGSICYKPIFASGASTTSPIFHSLDSFKGTLVLDEADFRFSDAKSEITKILNNGNIKGFPVLRCEGSSNGQYNPKAYDVFGPKIVATRGHYADPALESRFISERSKAGNIRKDIPINLPDTYEAEADTLRNKLLLFRFKYWTKINPDAVGTVNIEHHRIAQVFRPLLSLASSEEHRNIILQYATKSQSFLKSFRSHSHEEQILIVIAELQKRKADFSVKAITSMYQAKFGNQHTNPVTPKWIGSVIRNQLHLNTIKRRGVYIIPEIEHSKLKALFSRYDINTNSTVCA